MQNWQKRAPVWQYSLHIRSWHISDVPTDPDDVRFSGKIGSSWRTVKTTLLTQAVWKRFSYRKQPGVMDLDATG